MELIRVSSDVIKISVDRVEYSSDILHKCFYWYGNNYVVEINAEENLNFVLLKRIEGAIDDVLYCALEMRIKNDILDYKTRQIVHNETKHIKNILIAKAFSKLDQYDEAPKGEIQDPIGFQVG